MVKLTNGGASISSSGPPLVQGLAKAFARAFEKPENDVEDLRQPLTVVVVVRVPPEVVYFAKYPPPILPAKRGSGKG